MSVLTNILDKRQNGEIKTVTEKVYKSERLGEDIVIRKRPLSEFLEIVKESEEVGNEITAMNYMIHAFCPMFQDPDGVKATMEYYENQGIQIGSPRDLPEFVFDSDMAEMGKIVDMISSFYNMDGLEDDIKN